MKIKKVVVFFLLIITSFTFSQIQIKYKVSIEKNTKEVVAQILENDLGKPKEIKKFNLFWFHKTSNYEYMISLKKRKIAFFYKGNDSLIENKIRGLYLKVIAIK
jgi:hypothetical protein